LTPTFPRHICPQRSPATISGPLQAYAWAGQGGVGSWATGPDPPPLGPFSRKWVPQEGAPARLCSAQAGGSDARFFDRLLWGISTANHDARCQRNLASNRYSSVRKSADSGRDAELTEDHGRTVVTEANQPSIEALSDPPQFGAGGLQFAVRESTA
jgi:hypothetical protein